MDRSTESEDDPLPRASRSSRNKKPKYTEQTENETSATSKKRSTKDRDDSPSPVPEKRSKHARDDNDEYPGDDDSDTYMGDGGVDNDGDADMELDDADENEDVELATTKKNKSRRRLGRGALKQARAARSRSGVYTTESVAGGLNNLEDIDRVLAALIPAEVEGSDRLTNALSFKRIADQMDWDGMKEAPSTLLPLEIDALLARPRLRKLTYWVSGGSRVSGGKRFGEMFFHDAKDKINKPTKGNSIVGIQSRSIPGSSEPLLTRQELETIAPTCVKLFERYPGPWLGKSQSQANLRWDITMIAERHHYPQRRLIVPPITYASKGVDVSGVRYELHLHPRFLDGTTFDACRAVNPNSIDLAKASLMPPLPSNTLYFIGNQGGKSSTTCPVSPPSGLAEKDRKRHELAILFASRLGCALYQRIFENRSAFEGFVSHFTQRMVGSRGPNSSSGTYGGYTLYTLEKARSPANSVRIRLSSKPRADLGREPPTIRVHSSQWAHLNPVLEALDQAWLSGVGFRETWLRGCMAADAQNAALQDGQPILTMCEHDPTAPTAGVGHRCAGCGCFAYCGELEYDEQSQILVCRSCGSNHDRKSAFQRDELVQHKFKTVREFIRAESGPDVSKEEVTAMLKDLQSSVPGVEDLKKTPSTARDYYVPSRVLDLNTPRHRAISLDAKFPTAMDSEGKVRYHIAGNVVMTQLWLNFGKHIWEPGWVAILVEMAKLQQLLRDTNDDEKLSELQQRLRELLQQEKALFEIHLKTPFTRADRIALKMSRAQFAVIDYERRSGILIQPLKIKKGKLDPRTKWFNSSNLSPPRENWVPGPPGDFEARLEPLIKNILECGSVPVSCGEDGCPFPGPLESLPDGWNYWRAWCFFAERLLRMWVWCNGRWILVDNIETLYLTCLWLWTTGRRGMTGLDWTLLVHHPRRLVIGHAQHGQQMRGYFPKGATSLEDIDQDNANMRMETAFDNYAVHNFDEAAVKEIREDFFKIQIPLEDWNPNLPAPTNIDATTLQPVEVDDEVGVEELGGKVEFDEDGNAVERQKEDEEEEIVDEDQGEEESNAAADSESAAESLEDRLDRLAAAFGSYTAENDVASELMQYASNCVQAGDVEAFDDAAASLCSTFPEGAKVFWGV